MHFVNTAPLFRSKLILNNSRAKDILRIQLLKSRELRVTYFPSSTGSSMGTRENADTTACQMRKSDIFHLIRPLGKFLKRRKIMSAIKDRSVTNATGFARRRIRINFNTAKNYFISDMRHETIF